MRFVGSKDVHEIKAIAAAACPDAPAALGCALVGTRNNYNNIGQPLVE